VAITVLVIACPCALGLATPVALLVASGRGAQRGIVLREPRVLEVARNVDTVVFDKTGTITTGSMKLHEMVIIESPLGKDSSAISTPALLNLVLSIEALDSHPVAVAIASELRRQGFVPSAITEFEHRTGQGVAGRTHDGKALLIGSPLSIARSTTDFHPQIKSAIESGTARGNSIAVVAVDGIAYGVFEVGDSLKVDAEKAISTLHDQNINTWLVTGDSATLPSLWELQQEFQLTISLPVHPLRIKFNLLNHLKVAKKIQVNQLIRC
jgi:Cu+-exporting ATPase